LQSDTVKDHMKLVARYANNVARAKNSVWIL